MYVLNSDITIGNFRFSGVNALCINKSMHSIVETAVIILPSIAKVSKNAKVLPGTVITGTQFKDGDPVCIQLGYNGKLNTEFTGFVKQRNLNMPLEVVCEGYSYLLRRNTASVFWKTVSLKEYLQFAVSGIHSKYSIKVVCDLDLVLCNVLINNQSGFEMINDLVKYCDGNISCFFISTGVLWCGLYYSNCAIGKNVFNIGQVNYRLGYNVLKNNTLYERVNENDPTEVIYSKKLSTGAVLLQSSDVFSVVGSTHKRMLNTISSAGELKLLANEKAYQCSYNGYEGNIVSFLEPYVSAGYIANIQDSSYADKNGNYVVESTEVNFGINGARRIVEIGARIA